MSAAAARVEKTDAIVLKVRAHSNTSRIVSWLSPSQGRMVTLIKGACRPKSAFLGQFDLGYTCELLYYARDRAGMTIARECAPVTRRDPLRSDWRSALGASYCCDLVDLVAENAPSAGALYDPLADVLDGLALGTDRAAALLAFEVRLLTVTGLAPDLAGCPECRNDAVREVRFAVAAGRLVCLRCEGRESRSSAVCLPLPALEALRAAAARDTGGAALLGGCAAPERTALRRFLGLFMRYHLELPLVGRGVAWSAIGAGAGPGRHPLEGSRRSRAAGWPGTSP